MEIKELKIEIPLGYEIDKEKSTSEKVVFKKKDTKPRSWKEYCKLQKENREEGYMIDDTDNHIEEVYWSFLDIQNTIQTTHNYNCCRNILPSKKLAKAFLAMMQLMSLRQAWIGDWEPSWSVTTPSCIYCVCGIDNTGAAVKSFFHFRHPLSFPTCEMADDFMNTFKDLLEIAKPLI